VTKKIQEGRNKLKGDRKIQKGRNKLKGKAAILKTVMRKRTNSSKAGRYETRSNKRQKNKKQKNKAKTAQKKKRRNRIPNFVTLLRDTSVYIRVTAQLSAITFFLH
jgi:type II secretory pathway component PulC